MSVDVDSLKECEIHFAPEGSIEGMNAMCIYRDAQSGDRTFSRAHAEEIAAILLERGQRVVFMPPARQIVPAWRDDWKR